jgi:hypothetical protein
MAVANQRLEVRSLRETGGGGGSRTYEPIVCETLLSAVTNMVTMRKFEFMSDQFHV